MKKVFRTVALFAVLSVAAAGCMKEETAFLPDNINTRAETVVSYSANGENGSVSLNDDMSWDLFLSRMFALAAEGYSVTIYPSSYASSISCKETVTFTTTDQAEAEAWTKAMVLEGYFVNVAYDPKTGVWTCVATK